MAMRFIPPTSKMEGDGGSCGGGRWLDGNTGGSRLQQTPAGVVGGGVGRGQHCPTQNRAKQRRHGRTMAAVGLWRPCWRRRRRPVTRMGGEWRPGVGGGGSERREKGAEAGGWGGGHTAGRGSRDRRGKVLGFISLFDFLYLVTFLSPIFG